MRFGGKVALLTGGASAKGFGYHSAVRFAREGAQVVLTDIDGDAVAGRARELAAQGHDILAMPQDVTEQGSWDAVRDQVLDRYGHIDIVVNNAGIVQPAGIADTDLANWRAHIDVNLTGVFLGCQMAVRQMRAQGSGGAIINISSIAGQQAYPGMSGYVASKGGVRLLTKTVALDVAQDNIRVNSVYPGNMLTDMMERSIKIAPELVEGSIAKIPMKRLGRPDDIAAMVLFLASDEASYITGAEFTVDGGLTAGV